MDGRKEEKSDGLPGQADDFLLLFLSLAVSLKGFEEIVSPVNARFHANSTYSNTSSNNNSVAEYFNNNSDRLAASALSEAYFCRMSLCIDVRRKMIMILLHMRRSHQVQWPKNYLLLPGQSAHISLHTHQFLSFCTFPHPYALAFTSAATTDQFISTLNLLAHNCMLIVNFFFLKQSNNKY